jgi:hypothetical protein
MSSGRSAEIRLGGSRPARQRAHLRRNARAKRVAARRRSQVRYCWLDDLNSHALESGAVEHRQSTARLAFLHVWEMVQSARASNSAFMVSDSFNEPPAMPLHNHGLRAATRCRRAVADVWPNESMPEGQAVCQRAQRWSRSKSVNNRAADDTLQNSTFDHRSYYHS